jgi:hypothetical protein
VTGRRPEGGQPAPAFRRPWRRALDAVRTAVLATALRIDGQRGVRFLRAADRIRLAPRLAAGHDPAHTLLLRRSELALAAGDLAAARAGADVVYAALPGRPRVAALRREVLVRQGDVVERARQDYRTWAASPSEERASALRRTMGEVVVNADDWTPWVAAQRSPAAAARTTALLLVGGEPGRGEDGWDRLARRALASRSAGVDTTVVGPLAGDTGGRSHPLEAAGLEYREPRLGAAYPADVPVDRRLNHEAWLTVRLARSAPPDVVHVRAGGDDALERMLVGRAVARSLGRPLVCEPTRLPAGETDGADPGRPTPRHAAELRCLLAADTVIAGSDAISARLAGLGADPTRVAVIPDDMDDAASGTLLADVYRELARRPMPAGLSG